VPATPASAGGNRAAIQAQMFQEIDSLGEIEGKGGNARATLGVRCVEWAADGTADVGDAGPIYDHYIQKAQSVAAVFGGLKQKKDPEQGRKQNVSKVRQFLKMGGLKTIDPIKVINVAAGVVKDERAKGTIGHSPFDALLNIARKQCANTQAEMTRQEMIDCNQPRAPHDVAEADYLHAILVKLEKHKEQWGGTDETEEAMAQVSARIDELGGTTAEKKRKAAADAKAAKEAAKKAAKK
jgi:hypothetical protein